MNKVALKDTSRPARVALGLSGGVDSSVAVHLLQQAGCEVVGIHMQLVPASSRDAQAARDAQAVARHFGIEFHLLDARSAFEEEVITPFVQAYLHGQTPNPCVRCNAAIKFGVLWQEAQRLGCDKLATGHYVRIREENGLTRLEQAVDPVKDQSYFLWGIPRDVLAHVICPLGAYHKDETRAIAAQLGLTTAAKKESQEICFIPGDDYTAFLTHTCPDSLQGHGDFIDLNGRVIGQHDGAWRYTIGQRRGLGLALGYPAYVIASDADANTVTVGPGDALWHDQLIAERVNLLQPAYAQGEGLIKIRSRDKGTRGHWHFDGQTLHVQFDDPVRAITPGQSVVLYNGSSVIGGGIIRHALPQKP